MKALKPKTVFLWLVVMGCVPSIGYAQSLQEAIEESLIVPLAKLEAQAAQAGYFNRLHGSSSPEEHFADANTKARQGKKRARHCRATLKPVVELVEIVKCVQIVDAIADRCSTATEQFRLNKKFQVAAKFDTLKAHVMQCVTENITGYSALVRYLVMPEAKDRYAGLIEKCRQEETNALGVLGYQFIWPCFKGYLDMIDEPLEPPPTEISPEPAEDSDTLPKVKA